MKKITKILAVVMAVLMLCLALASCGKKLSGKYTADVLGTGVAMTFDGSDVKIAITVATVEVASVDAKYEIKDDKISFDFADEEEVENALAKKVLESLEEPVSFEEGDDYIKIAGTKYKKAD